MKRREEDKYEVNAIQHKENEMKRSKSKSRTGSVLANLAGVTLLAAVAVVFLVPAQAALISYETVVKDSEPYAYWRFNEASGTTAVDASGNDRDGTYINSPTFGIAGAGGAGSDNAVGFDGVDQLMSASIAAFGSSLATSTFEAVFSTTTASSQSLFGTFNNDVNTGVAFTLNNGGNLNLHRLYLRGTGGGGNNAEMEATFTSSDLRSGNFNHLMIAINSAAPTAANRVAIYVNGVQQTLNIAGAAIDSDKFAAFQHDFTVAAFQNRLDPASWMDGVIDEFAIYDKTLTQADAQAHFAAIPEPATFAMIGGLLALALVASRRVRRTA